MSRDDRVLTDRLRFVIPAVLLAGVLGVAIVVMVIDLALAYRRRRVPSVLESSIWIAIYSALALGFASILLGLEHPNLAGQFVAGWLTEYSLSLDNLFVFVLILARFAVPRSVQEEVLLIGIVLALVLRGLFILLGVTLISHFGWIFYLFGGFLFYTAVKQVLPGREADEQEQEIRLVQLIRRRLSVAQFYNGARLTVRVDGKRMLTPVLLVILAIGVTDVLFAFDSIPAIFGITHNAAIVFAANLFALMGLRQLYFLLRKLLDRLTYLTYGISAILVFIAAKLVLHALHDNRVVFINGGHGVSWAPEIGTGTTLVVIFAAMGVAIILSVIPRSAKGLDASQRGESPT